ncbi:putative cupin domain protein [Lasiodiplodia theobromae]|uniref:AraC-type transcription regulator ligand-binding domain-containing protein n=2 Tax=Lasiodiplodia TaxID=66739 RepID=A0A5N5DFS7_9PEZI|nr:Cupin domain-containing protein [Lasiodiplodia theobromae]KAB2576678.1 hypothetical protein DBV05_g4671 [Lasiodiplodia theobromae]KAF4534004.1 Cupin domain-containing protein [Lasiodiplodia theobromae]KAF9633149.1 putative cupin domain protein [Lasiodiplodia theobromae]KAK0663282.1 hypothetical protein DIS24_g1461 [Lasiodiplodia hormozganensis]
MADAPAAHEPEFHRFEPTSDTPNSVMPVLVYRNAFSTTMPIGEVRNILHTNRWLPDPIAETNKTPLFQSTTHELHAVVRGRCQLLVGGTQYGPPPGMMIYLSAGDMVVYPAGVSHCVVNSENFEFITFRPERSNKRDNVEPRAFSPKEMKGLQKNISKVVCPKYDPLAGKEGPLVEIWRVATIQENIATSWW